MITDSEIRSQQSEPQELVGVLHTEGWRVDALLNGVPIEDVEFKMVDRDDDEPEEARELRGEIWTQQLEQRRTQLLAANPELQLSIKDDTDGTGATNMPALFEGNARKMWAGAAVTLAPDGIVHSEGKTQLHLVASSYSEQVACLDPRYREIYEAHGVELPNIGFAASMIMRTSDGHIVLTRRGIETPIYPGRLYMPGGGPKPGQTSVGAMLEEMAEEVGLTPGDDFDPVTLKAVAVVTDTNFVGSGFGHPDLIGSVAVNRTLRELAEIQYARARGRNRLQDVWMLESVLDFPPTLHSYIQYNGPQMCPPTEAALVLSAVLQESEDSQQQLENARLLMQTINSFARTEFVPSITRMR